MSISLCLADAERSASGAPFIGIQLLSVFIPAVRASHENFLYQYINIDIY